MKYVLTMFVIFGAISSLSGCEVNNKPAKIIQSVGGCDGSGNCGIKFTDGTFATAYYPVPGKTTTEYFDREF